MWLKAGVEPACTNAGQYGGGIGDAETAPAACRWPDAAFLLARRCPTGEQTAASLTQHWQQMASHDGPGHNFFRAAGAVIAPTRNDRRRRASPPGPQRETTGDALPMS